MLFPIIKEKFLSLIDKTLYLRGAFIILLPIMLYVDYVTPKRVESFYIILMILIGVTYIRTPLHLVFSGLLAFARFKLNDDLPFPSWDVFIFQWISYFLISFSVMTLLQKYKAQKTYLLNLTTVLANSLDSRDEYTAYHSENVARYSKMIAKELQLSSRVVEHIYTGGLLHDIGKIGVPEALLKKPGKLTEEEFEKIKKHPEIGYNMLKIVPEFKNNGVLDIVLFHHERFDGKGYPTGRKGKEIPLVARITAIADTFDAMTTQRVYRKSRDIESALNEIKINSGTQFDPEVVAAFLNIFEKRRDQIVKQDNNIKDFE